MNEELNCIGCGVKGCDGKAGCDYYEATRPKHGPESSCEVDECEKCHKVSVGIKEI